MQGIQGGTLGEPLLEVVLQDRGSAAFPPAALHRAARDLARVEDAVAWIAEGLGVGCNPLAMAK
jgi:hypothetical protein